MASVTRWRLAVLLLAGLLSSAGAVYAQPWSGDLTLAGSIAAALEKNPSYLGVRLSLATRQSETKEAQARTRPQLSTTLTESSRRNEAALGPEVVLSLSQSVQAFHPLLVTPRYPLPLTPTSTSDLASRQAAAKLAKARAELVFSVTQGYYSVLKARSLVDVQAEGVKSAEAARSDAQAKLAVGTGTKLDVLRADLEVANAQVALAKAKNSVAQAEADFFSLLGADPPAAPVALATPPSDAGLPGDSVEQLTETALKTRHELLDAQLGIDRAISGLSEARRGLLPTISLSTSYSEKHLGGKAFWEPLSGQAGWSLDLTPMEPLPTPGSGTSGGEWVSVASVSYPLFDAGIQAETVKQSELALRQAQVAYEQAAAQVRTEVLNAYLSYTEAKNRLDALEKALAQTTEARRLTELRVRNGAGTTSELIDANRDLSEARVNLLQAQFDHQVSLARVRKATALDEEV